MSKESRPDWMNVTNLLVTIALAVNAIIWMRIESIDNKMFVHLTNASLHIPRETVVSKDEFVIYQTMRDRQMNEISVNIVDLKKMMQEHLNDEINRQKRNDTCK